MTKVCRAKMQCQEVAQTTYSDKVSLVCVYGGSTNAEDNTFAKASPSGKLEIQIDNPALRGVIKPGDVFYVDLTLVCKDPAL